MATSDQKRSLHLFYWTWGILTVVGVVLSIWLPHRYMPKMMSNDGHLALATTILFSVLAAPVAGGVYAAAFYIIRKYRYRGEGVPPPAEQVRENTKTLVWWLTASTVLTVFVLVWGLGALAAENASSSSNPLIVNVTGQQWVWTFAYPARTLSPRSSSCQRTVKWSSASRHGCDARFLGRQLRRAGRRQPGRDHHDSHHARCAGHSLFVANSSVDSIMHSWKRWVTS